MFCPRINSFFAHEISHAFDNNGAHFDENGNMNNWWTDTDFAKFNEMTGKMIRQWDGIPYLDDKVNGELVVSEVDASRPGMDYKSSPVKAPVSGTITSFPLNIGSTVSASTSIGKISSTGKLEIKTNVAERFISRISMYQKAELTFDAYPGEKFPATLVEIDPVLDTTSRTLGIKLIQEPTDPRLRAGMYARIKLVTDSKKNTIVIPNNVVVTRNDEDIVYIIDPQTNTVKASPVKKGIRVDDKQEIEMGITPGDLIVIKGQALLTDGAKVNIVSITE